mgnify:CR=1 FL=1
MTNYFNSKYPIIALAMNQVSDAKFAIECSNAGIYPSISLFNYYKNNTINYERFIRETTLNNFMLSLTILDLKNKYVGFGVGLSDNQFELIKGNSKLVKRYAEISNRKFDSPYLFQAFCKCSLSCLLFLNKLLCLDHLVFILILLPI